MTQEITNVTTRAIVLPKALSNLNIEFPNASTTRQVATGGLIYKTFRFYILAINTHIQAHTHTLIHRHTHSSYIKNTTLRQHPSIKACL